MGCKIHKTLHHNYQIHENEQNTYQTEPHFHHLDLKVLSTPSLEDIVDLAYGCQLNTKSKRKNTSPFEIDLANFGEALRLINPTDPRAPEKKHTHKEKSTETIQDIIEPAMKFEEPKESLIKSAAFLKKLTTHEKKLLSTVVDPGI